MKKILILVLLLGGCSKKAAPPVETQQTASYYGYEWVLSKESDDNKTTYDCFNTQDGGWEGMVVTGKLENVYFNAYYVTIDSSGARSRDYSTFKDLPSAERYVEKKANERKVKQ